ncbi:MAG: NADH-quinone oxidoreductase subunit J [Acidobacteriaceae bacterium]|nr:NADH-quinone oxidoreductase subunit J [Acidobacteriaceae bacterium]MBV9294783.1 NADH-quinone oxidoreductase subunit J [Acidobacteriaceae bacterium]MBV9764906.1 NADH-quinone oxidoreductase subunit J [Acidobacteriaceae bacterium]
MDTILFIVFAIVAIVCAFNLVLQRHPISSALSLIGVMGSLAVLYLLLGAEFIAMAQVIVYGGAVMVLFVLVIMLLNAGTEKISRKSWFAQIAGLPLLLAFVALLGFLIRGVLPPLRAVQFGSWVGGTAERIGQMLFTQYLLPFEIISILILIAILGAVVLAHKEFD